MKFPEEQEWRVLHIDDDEDDFLLTRSMLAEAHGQKVHLEWASTFQEGRQRLLTGRYDAVLVDYDLGAGTGLDLIREFVQRDYPAPLILFTGRGNYEVDLEAMHAGATLYLTKAEVNAFLLERSIRYAIERKQAEQARRASERQYRLLFETMLPGVIYQDAQGKVLSMNPAAERILGRTPADFLDPSPLDAAHPTLRGDGTISPPEEHPSRQALRTGQEVRGVVMAVFNPRENAYHWITINAVPLFHKDDLHAYQVYTLFDDITERRQARQALHRSQQVLAQAGQMARLGAWEVQLSSLEEMETHPQIWSDETYRIFGYEPGSIKATNDLFYAHVLPDDQPRLRQAIREAILNHTPYNIEHRIKRTDGAERYILEHAEIVYNDSGQLEQIVGAIQDITDRKLTELALQEEQRKLRESNDLLYGIIDTTNGLIAALDPSYRYILMNKAYQEEFAAIFGVEIHPGSSLIEALAHLPDDQKAALDLWTQALQGQNLEIVSDFGDPTNQKRKTYEMRFGPIRDGEGKIIGAGEIGSDASQRAFIEKALRESEEQYRSYFEMATFGAGQVDAVSGRLVRVNDRYCQITGYSRAELEGKSVYELTHPVDLVEDQKHFQQLLRGEIREYSAEKRFIRKDGQVIWVLAAARLVSDSDGYPLRTVSIIQDITKRKIAETELNESQEKLSAVLESIHDGFFVLDQSWRCTYANQRAAEIAGLTPPEMVGRTIREIFPFLEDSEVSAYSRQVLQQRVPIQFQTDDRLNGNIYDVRIYPSGEGISVLIIDRTEQIKAERTLRGNEERLMLALQAAGMVTWEWNIQNDQLTITANSSSVPELNGMLLKAQDGTELILPEDRQFVNDSIQAGVEQAKPFNFETRVILPDIGIRWISVQGHTITGLNGLSPVLMGVAQDITARKQNEEALQNYANQLERSNKVLQDFAFFASHDLQEPLRKIQAFGRLLQDSFGQELGEDGKDYIARINAAAARMSSMVQGLLEYSRVSSTGQPFVPVDLNQIAREVLTDLEVRVMQTRAQIQIDPLPGIQADPLQMRELLQNLIVNGLKFHRPGVAPVVKISGQNLPNGLTELIIADNGIGFDSKDAEQLFHPFHRLNGKTERDGSGMGLAICHKIVERHGGKITAAGQPGQGATFTILLPTREKG